MTFTCLIQFLTQIKKLKISPRVKLLFDSSVPVKESKPAHPIKMNKEGDSQGLDKCFCQLMTIKNQTAFLFDSSVRVEERKPFQALQFCSY